MAERTEHLCIATLPDQRQFKFGVSDLDTLQSVLERIVRDAGYTTPRKSPEAIPVAVAKLQPPKKPGDDWQTITWASRRVMPPVTRMTQEEFDAESRQLLLRIPPVLHAAFHKLAWDQGHSAGLEEVFNYLQEYVSEFEQPLIKYRQQLLNSSDPGA
jgi:hypothetical protein